MNTGLKPCFFNSSTVFFVVSIKKSSLPVLNHTRPRPRLLAALSSAVRFCFSHAWPNEADAVAGGGAAPRAPGVMMPELKTPM